MQKNIFNDKQALDDLAALIFSSRRAQVKALAGDKTVPAASALPAPADVFARRTPQFRGATGQTIPAPALVAPALTEKKSLSSTEASYAAWRASKGEA